MAVKPDLALCLGAGRLAGTVRIAIDLPAGIAADLAVDTGFQAHGVETVSQGAEAGIAIGRGSRREGVGADQHAAIGLPPLCPPAIVYVDETVSLGGKPGIDDDLRRGDDLFLVDIGAEGVPAVPAHRGQGGRAARGDAPFAPCLKPLVCFRPPVGRRRARCTAKRRGREQRCRRKLPRAHLRAPC